MAKLGRRLKEHLPPAVWAIVEAPVRRLRKALGYNCLHVREAWTLAGSPSSVLVVGAVRYLGIEVDDALAIAEQVDV